MAQFTKSIEATYIPCEVSDGAFSSEYAVTIKPSNRQEVSLFADRSLVIKEQAHHWLRVTQISSEGPVGVYLLPTETMENGSRWVKVLRKDTLQR